MLSMHWVGLLYLLMSLLNTLENNLLNNQFNPGSFITQKK